MKFNKNIIVFVAAMLFILLGFTQQYYDNLKYTLISFVVQNEDAAEDFPALQKVIDKISTNELRYHNEMMNLNSLKQRLTGNRIVVKDTTTVVHVPGGSLIEPQKEKFTEEEMARSIDAIIQLQKCAQDSGAEFLYIAAPRKSVVIDTPEWVIDYRKESVASLINGLAKNDVPMLNLCELLEEKQRLNLSLFFNTDHHWKPEVGFWATGEICRELNERYGFEYESKYNEISNYNISVHKDCFLGSYGKKVGLYYVPGGADDISIITPKFETSFTEQRPYSNVERSGDFQTALLYMENINEVDYYRNSPYVTYSGGDFRLQILKNHLNPEGKKILILRDSFACVVTPFLALNASELHIADTRYFIPSEPLNVYDYIEEIKPDYVLLLYSGAGFPPDGDGCFNYDQNPS